jgi:hypothetical protein
MLIATKVERVKPNLPTPEGRKGTGRIAKVG